jgi:hypothetical protein
MMHGIIVQMPKGQNSFNPTKYPKKGSLIISKTKEQI